MPPAFVARASVATFYLDGAGPKPAGLGVGAAPSRCVVRPQELHDSIEQPARSRAQSGRRAANASRPGCSS